MDEKTMHEQEAPDARAEETLIVPKPRSRGKKLLLPTLLSAALIAGAAQYAGCGDPKPPGEAVADGTGPVEGTKTDGSDPPEFDPELPIA